MVKKIKISLRQLRNVILLIALVLISGGVGFWFGKHEIKFKGLKGLRVQKVEIINKAVPVDKKLDFSLFWEVWDKLEEKYLEKEKLNKEKMFYGAIQGLAASLGDPYTVFLPPKKNKQAKEDLNGSFGGVGIRLGFKDDNKLTVISPLKGSPAEAAGVRAGDLILHIKDENKGIDEDTAGITLPEAVEKIRGLEGTKVYLTLLHEGESEPFVAEIVRDTIIVPSVEVEFIENDKCQTINNSKCLFAHLKLMRFGELTAKQWDESIEKIKTKRPEIKGVILDVRGNPGGYLRGAVNLASEFLSKGVVVKQENYKGEIETYSVNRRGRLLDIPLVVLIDKGSASASEILAGALQDHGRAKLVGTRSFGKGTIQESEDLSAGAGLHITTAKWLTPNGAWVNKEGLKPDFEIENDPNKPEEDKQLEKAIEILSIK